MCVAHVEYSQIAPRRSDRPGLGRLLQRVAGAAVVAVLLMGGDVKVGLAAVPQNDPFADLEVLGAAELAEKRGGFMDKILGITLNLGAEIRSMVNGKLALLTTVKFDRGGNTEVSHNVPEGTNITGLTFLSSDGAPIAGLASTNTTGPVTVAAGSGSPITVPSGFTGVVTETETGATLAVSKVTKDQFANLVVNTDPSAAVQQSLNINIDVFGLAGLQQNIKLNTALSRFREAMRAASLGALGIN